MKKLFSFVVLFGLFAFGINAHAQTAGDVTTTSNTETTEIVKEETSEKVGWDKLENKSSWKDYKGNMMWDKSEHRRTGGSLGTLWMIGWLFSIGYLRLTFWKGVLALIIWPYYLGKRFNKHNQ